jgi:uncharacterized protein (DUF1800 family)
MIISPLLCGAKTGDVVSCARSIATASGAKFMKSRFSSLAFVLCIAGALHAQSIVITPGYESIGVNQTLQYSAAVTGLMNTTVTWSVVGVVGGNSTYGTITPAGLYKAPAAIPANGITVSALGSDSKTSAIVYVNVAPPGPAVTSISPNPIPAGNATVIVGASGLQAGATMVCNGVQLGGTTITATTITGGVWIPTGTSTFYCSIRNPGTLFGAALVIPVKAATPVPPAGGGSGSGGGSGGSVPVVSPLTATVVLGATQQFAAPTATSWSATSGTVTAAGLYTAPAAMPASGSDVVTATNATGSATAKVTLISNVAPVIQSVSLPSLPLGVFSMTLTGTGFVAASKATLGSSTLTVTAFTALTLSVSGFAGTSGNVNLIVNNGPIASQPYLMQVGIPNPQVSAAAARRFLEQAAFGPTPADALHVQQIGFQSWINEQLAMAPVSTYNAVASQGGMATALLTNAVTNPDQLRQRMAFAWSQIFVTSINKLIWNQAVAPYQQMLLNDAFANYRKILGDVTLSPGMGQYLDMANNAKANAAQNIVANENYAREVLQLFSLGTKTLNQDGSVQYDANNLPVPTYSQFTITEFARVYTGWTYAPAPGNPVQWGVFVTQNGPMVPYAPMHDTGAKTLLNGHISPAGISAQLDLNNALDNIYGHSNVGPYIGMLLIQHMVKSNPSPAYIQRVAAAFADNGLGVRGDMGAVVTAILLDPEARANDNGGSDQPTDGHLQEPALLIAGMVRAFGGQMNLQNYFSYDLFTLNEDIFNSPSVFNYFSPFFRAPGTALFGPEFQIDTPNNSILRANVVAGLFSAYQNAIETYGPGTTVDLTAFVSLASTPATLADALDLTLTHGTMPGAMKQLLVAAITNDAGGNISRVENGCYFILTSGYYNVWH